MIQGCTLNLKSDFTHLKAATDFIFMKLNSKNPFRDGQLLKFFL